MKVARPNHRAPFRVLRSSFFRWTHNAGSANCGPLFALRGGLTTRRAIFTAED